MVTNVRGGETTTTITTTVVSTSLGRSYCSIGNSIATITGSNCCLETTTGGDSVGTTGPETMSVSDHETEQEKQEPKGTICRHGSTDDTNTRGGPHEDYYYHRPRRERRGECGGCRRTTTTTHGIV